MIYRWQRLAMLSLKLIFIIFYGPALDSDINVGWQRHIALDDAQQPTKRLRSLEVNAEQAGQQQYLRGVADMVHNSHPYTKH
jgi:hypothetical protein